MKTTRLSYAIFFILSVLFFVISGFLLFLLPQREFSENENRCLTTFRPPEISGFLDTSMQQNLTDAANDQFAGRDFWMKCATSIQKAAGFQNAGGVYFGKDGYYFERLLDSDLPKQRYLKHLQFLEQFANNYDFSVTFLPVPSKGCILEDKLPSHAVVYRSDRLYDQAGQLSSTSVLDVRQLFSDNKNREQLYFKTDHHWTMYAAYLAYTAWCDMHGMTGAPLEQFQPECVSNNFFGTLYSKAPGFDTQPDPLILPVRLPKAEVIIDTKRTDCIYDNTKLETKDKYGVYFGGNFGRIDLHMDNAVKDQTLLIVKDSFANSLVPFLMNEYRHIVMIDFRYYHQPFSRLLEELQPKEVLILYEISNFAQDINFFKILK